MLAPHEDKVASQHLCGSTVDEAIGDKSISELTHATTRRGRGTVNLVLQDPQLPCPTGSIDLGQIGIGLHRRLIV